MQAWIDYLIIKRSGLFDDRFYLKQYSDIRHADVDPLMHYIRHGWKENRNPSPSFDTRSYVEANPELIRKKINPLIYYLRHQEHKDIDAAVEFSAEPRRARPQSPAPARPVYTIGQIEPGKNRGLKRFTILLSHGWSYLRSNGLKKFVTRLLVKLGNPQRKINRVRRSVSFTSKNDPYNRWYKESLAIANNSNKRDYVEFIEHRHVADPQGVKLIAFYLPQFHPIPENNLWWGPGFTEWTNVSKAVPQFIGHYQPHLPGELGFYDLRVPEVQRRQVELAQNYGIYGFCFYYYWFAGKKLLEAPLERFTGDAEIDFPFCICWANENWTRRWDGFESDVLIGQVHTPETDGKFIRDIIPLFKHKNYIRINGRPILIVYRVDLLAEPQKTVKIWQEQCLLAGLPEPYLIVAQNFGYSDPNKVGFDAAVEFPPNNISPEIITDKLELLNENFSGDIYPYAGKSSLSELYMTMKHSGYKIYKTVAPGWDNEPRRPGRGNSFAFSSPDSYKAWLQSACEFATHNLNADDKLVFINAWNEWGEGAYLEPDRKYGYAYLQATYEAGNLATRPVFSSSSWMILFILHDANIGGSQIVIKNIITWLHDHTSIVIKILLLNPGALLAEYSALGDTLVVSESDLISRGELLSTVTDLCGRKPDLVYGNTVAVGKIYELVKQIGSPIITHIHELEMSINRYASGWIDILCKNTDHFIAASNFVRNNMQANHNVSPGSISTVYEGVPARDASISTQEKQALKDKLGIPKGKKVVVGCGIGMPFRKGADLFIRVSQGIQHKLIDKTECLWIGDFDPNEYDEQFGHWQDFQRLVKDEPDIQFLGFQTHPIDYLQIADVFLLTSREDPFPLVVMEAAQCGLPVICFDQAGGAPEFVSNDAGIVVPYCNVEKMVEASVELLTNDTLRRSLGDNAKKRVAQSYTIGSIAPQILSVCRKIAKKKPTVSIIVPNYNHAAYLPGRLDSIFNQDFRDFEVIILDDASTDKSLDVIQMYSAVPDVKVIQNRTNSGSPFHQWKVGLEQAQGDLIWIAESDDRCDKDFLTLLLPAFGDPRVLLAYSNSWIINSDDELVGDYLATDYLKDLSVTKWHASYKLPAEKEINDGLGVKNTILNISSAIFRKPSFSTDTYQALDGMRYTGDWLFIVNLIHGGYIYYDAHKLNYHRRHVESVIGDLLKHKRVNDFYAEIARVHKSVCELYQFDPGFIDKWSSYHQKQWAEFAPTSTFEQLTAIYPYQEIMNLIRQKSRPK